MTWQYTIEWSSGGGSDANHNKKNIAIVTSKPRSQKDGNIISVSAWTNLDDNATNETSIPLAIYAKVSRGDGPVVDARVSVIVTIEQTNGSVITMSPIRLLDNGYGGENEAFDEASDGHQWEIGFYFETVGGFQLLIMWVLCDDSKCPKLYFLCPI